MNTKRNLIAVGACLTLPLLSAAEPRHPLLPPAKELAESSDSHPTEAKIRHLEQAAGLLAETGLPAEAKRLREQAALMRNDLRNRHQELERILDELHATLQAVQEENRALRRKLEQSAEKAPAPAPSFDRAAAEAHNRQTLEMWQKIKDAAQGNRPLPPQEPVPPQHQTPTPPRQHEVAPPALPETDGRDERDPHRDAADTQNTILQQILHTLQRIEQKMGQ